MPKKNLTDLTTGKQIQAYVRKHPALVSERQSGSHWIPKTARGSAAIPVHGNKQLPEGTRKSILAQLALIGITAVGAAVGIIRLAHVLGLI